MTLKKSSSPHSEISRYIMKHERRNDLKQMIQNIDTESILAFSVERFVQHSSNGRADLVAKVIIAPITIKSMFNDDVRIARNG